MTGKRVTTPTEDIVAAYSRGLNMREIADALGIEYRSVKKRLKDAGVSIIPYRNQTPPDLSKSIHTGKSHGMWVDIPLDEMRGMLDEGQSVESVAKHFRVTAKVITKRMSILGIKLAERRRGNGMYVICEDGNIARSSLEASVCNWLYKNHIEHTDHPRLPFAANKWSFADFRIDSLYIEIWGIERRKSYAQYRERKTSLYLENGLALLSLEPSDFPNGFQEKILTALTRRL